MASRAPKSSWIVHLCTLGTFLIIYVPLIALVIYSFAAFDPNSGSTSWTLDWYRQAFSDETLRAALWVSLHVGFWSTLGSTILGTSAALALERSKIPGQKIIDSFTLVPLVVPEIVFGLSLLIWFVFLNLTLGSFSMILAHITFSFSYVLITVRSRMKNFDYSLEEAAKDLGASPVKTFFRITLPLITPAIVSGALMAFTISFDDFLISFFTAGIGSDTLPIKLYSMIKYGISPKINALSTMILGVTILLVVFVFRPVEKKAEK